MPACLLIGSIRFLASTLLSFGKKYPFQFSLLFVSTPVARAVALLATIPTSFGRQCKSGCSIQFLHPQIAHESGGRWLCSYVTFDCYFYRVTFYKLHLKYVQAFLPKVILKSNVGTSNTTSFSSCLSIFQGRQEYFKTRRSFCFSTDQSLESSPRFVLYLFTSFLWEDKLYSIQSTKKKKNPHHYSGCSERKTSSFVYISLLSLTDHTISNFQERLFSLLHTNCNSSFLYQRLTTPRVSFGALVHISDPILNPCTNSCVDFKGITYPYCTVTRWLLPATRNVTGTSCHNLKRAHFGILFHFNPFTYIMDSI